MSVAKSKLILLSKVSHHIGVNKATLHDWIKSGFMPAVRLPPKRFYYVPTNWVDAYRTFEPTDIPKIKADRLDVKQAAVVMCVSRITINRWIKLGKMKVFRMPGGKRLVPISEIERLLINTKYETKKNTGN